jgi:hypothetical protein
VSEEKRYIYRVSEYGESEIMRAEVVKETAKMVYIGRWTGGFGYKERYSKDEVFWTAQEAVDAYTERQEKRLEGLKRQINTIRSRLGELPGALKRFEEGQE